MEILQHIWGTTPEGEAIVLYTIRNANGCEVHSTVILSQVDEDTFKRLGLNITCDPLYQSNKLYHK